MGKSTVSDRIPAGEYSVGNVRVDPMMKTEIQSGQTFTVVLPAYCAAENIEDLIRELQGLKLTLLITVIGDSSPNGTTKIVRKLQKEYDTVILFVRSKVPARNVMSCN